MREILSRAGDILLSEMESIPLLHRAIQKMQPEGRNRIARRIAKAVLLECLQSLADGLTGTDERLERNPFKKANLKRMEVRADEQQPVRWCHHCAKKVRAHYKNIGLRCPDCGHGTVQLTAKHIREKQKQA